MISHTLWECTCSSVGQGADKAVEDLDGPRLVPRLGKWGGSVPWCISPLLAGLAHLMDVGKGRIEATDAADGCLEVEKAGLLEMSSNLCACTRRDRRLVDNDAALRLCDATSDGCGGERGQNKQGSLMHWPARTHSRGPTVGSCEDQ